MPTDKVESTTEVAPGYPTADSLDQLDVTEWEPSVVFRPAESPIDGQGESA